MPVDWDRAYASHAGAILRVAMVIVGREDRAADVLHNCFEVAIRKEPGYDPKRPLEPWLMGIATREALKLARRERLRAALPLGEGPGRPTAMTEAAGEVWDAVRRLPPRQRAAVALSYLHGYQLDEIAAVLGVPRGTVGSRLHTAREALRVALGELPAGVDATA